MSDQNSVSPPEPPKVPVGPINVVAAEPPTRKAIVYFPGLFEDGTTDPIEAVAHRIARALDNIDDDRSISYSVGQQQVERFDTCTTRTATVSRRERVAGHEEVVATVEYDVYEVDYRTPLTGGFGRMLPAMQALQISAVLTANMPNFVAAAGRRGQSIPQKLQVWYGGAMMGVLMAYLVMLLLTAILTGERVVNGSVREPARTEQPKARETTPPPATQQPTGQTPASGGQAAPQQQTVTAPQPSGEQPKGSPEPEQPERGWWAAFWAWLASRPARILEWARANLAWLQTGVVTITVFGMVLPFNLKSFLARMSGEITSAAKYLGFGRRRDEVVGQLTRLLDYIGSKPDVRYANVHFIGYSFGSVVALDGLFQDSEVAEPFQMVDSVVTIGCPADFIRTYWKRYFNGRYRSPGDVCWINVRSPADVLASNFVQGKACGIGAGEGVAVQSGSKKKGVGVKLADGEERLPHEHISFGPAAPEGAWEWIGFILTSGGFTAHGSYWEKGKTSQGRTCFESVMRRLRAVERARAAARAPAPPPAAAPPPPDLDPAPPPPEPAPAG